MSDESVFSTSETEENLVSAPPFAPITADVLLPLSVGRRNRSEAWNHFTTNPGSDKRARCNYCSCLIKYDNGTSSMRSHLMRCKNNPNKDGNKRQKSISSSIVKAEGLVGSSSLCDKFDQEACRNGLVKMIIGTDLPIPMVGRKVFREFLNSLQPRFRVPSCATLVHDILKLWDAERTKLKSVLSQHSGRVCLTIDKWTSCQDLSYMCLTSHFVDNNYILHKRILNFCPIESCSGEVMAKTIELCLNGWGLSHVLSLTADHVLPNDLGIQYLKKRLMSWNNLVLKGEYIHMHCCPHILNIIVKEGLSDIDDSILRISAAVKYIRSSPSILSKFEACVDDEEKIEYKGLVCLDVEAKWNLIYEMLEGALNHRKIFEDLELQDKEYVHELEKGKGVPTCEDWNNARLILPFLKIFYEAMLRISGTSYVTSNVYMLEVFGIGRRIRKMCHSKDVSIRRMAERLRKKYDEYWGNPDTLNMLLLIAVIFNPRCKVGYMNWIINQIFDLGEAANLKEKLESCLKLLFEEYIDGEEEPQNDSQEARFDEDGKENPYSWNQFLQSTRHKSSVRFELNKYLEEDIETSPDLDILNWWKLNSNRFPILANIAREVLAIPVSTIASEFAFSTGAKMLDSYCSFLTPELLEALVCTQDLLNGTPSSLVSYKDMEKLKLSDKDMERLKQGKIIRCLFWICYYLLARDYDLISNGMFFLSFFFFAANIFQQDLAW